MAQELLYTSAPRGLKPGSSGFCTVAMSNGMPDTLAAKLEMLSGYRAVFPAGSERAGDNPVLWAHWIMSLGGKTRHVLSRVSFAGFDYSQRSNKFAHHIVLDESELPAGGPASVMLRPGIFQSRFEGEPRLLPAPPRIAAEDFGPRVCAGWAKATGDAGWGGALADAFIADPRAPAFVICTPDQDMLALFDESLALLPPKYRWQITFSTYFTELPMGYQCAWRCVLAGSAEAKQAAMGRGLVIDLTKTLGAAPEGPMAAAARTGKQALIKSAAVSSPESSGRGNKFPSVGAFSRRSASGAAVTNDTGITDDFDEVGTAPLGALPADQDYARPRSDGPVSRPRIPVLAMIAMAVLCAAGGAALGWFLHQPARVPPAGTPKASPNAAANGDMVGEIAHLSDLNKALVAKLAHARKRYSAEVAANKRLTSRLRNLKHTAKHPLASKHPRGKPIATIPRKPSTTPAKKPVVATATKSKWSYIPAYKSASGSGLGEKARPWSETLGAATTTIDLLTPMSGGTSKPSTRLKLVVAKAGKWRLQERTHGALGGTHWKNIGEISAKGDAIQWRWRRRPAKRIARLLPFTSLAITTSRNAKPKFFLAFAGGKRGFTKQFDPTVSKMVSIKAPYACDFTLAPSAAAAKIVKRGSDIFWLRKPNDFKPTNIIAKVVLRWNARRRSLSCLSTWPRVIRVARQDVSKEKLIVRSQKQRLAELVKRVGAASAAKNNALLKQLQKLRATDQRQLNAARIRLRAAQPRLAAVEHFSPATVHLFIKHSQVPFGTIVFGSKKVGK